MKTRPKNVAIATCPYQKVDPSRNFRFHEALVSFQWTESGNKGKEYALCASCFNCGANRGTEDIAEQAAEHSRGGRATVYLGGAHIQFVVACTMVDAFFGAIPLLWRTSIGLSRNFLRLFAAFAGVFFVNIVRLEAGFVALNSGVPWWLAHECVAGITYFCLLLFIVHEQPWINTPAKTRVVLSCLPTSYKVFREDGWPFIIARGREGRAGSSGQQPAEE
jgi:hypothetical protein